MDNDPTNLLQQALARDIKSLLIHEGIELTDREIIIPADDVDELDVTDIVVGYNDEFHRTVCHVHRPPTDEVYWRHQTYVVWDDGRTAWFETNIVLNETETLTLGELRASHNALLAEFDTLTSQRVIDIPDAMEMYDGILAELERITSVVNDTLLKSDEFMNRQDTSTIKAAIEKIESDVPIGEAPYPEFTRLYKAIRDLRDAHYRAIELRAQLVERHMVQTEYSLERAESAIGAVAPAKATWDLLQLLDRIR